jgi:hypothetical protein
MTGDEKIRKCAHAGCPCPADPGTDYCNEDCRLAQGSGSGSCTCPHELCQQARRTTRERLRSGSYEPGESQGDKEKPLMDDWGKSDKH